MNNIVTNPDCPDKATVRQQAEEMAAELRVVYPDRTVEVVECLLSHFQVKVKFPFRTEHRHWNEQEETEPADA